MPRPAHSASPQPVSPCGPTSVLPAEHVYAAVIGDEVPHQHSDAVEVGRHHVRRGAGTADPAVAARHVPRVPRGDVDAAAKPPRLAVEEDGVGAADRRRELVGCLVSGSRAGGPPRHPPHDARRLARFRPDDQLQHPHAHPRRPLPRVLRRLEAHVSVYPIPDGDDAYEAQLASYRSGASTAKFPLGKQIPLDLIARIRSSSASSTRPDQQLPSRRTGVGLPAVNDALVERDP